MPECEHQPGPNDRGPYYFRRDNARLLECQAPEVLLSGPAGSGKTLAGAVKLHVLAESVPGLRALIVRKTRESLTESALVTFEEQVVPVDHPILKKGGQRRLRQAYAYPNGSQIVVGGMDKPSKIMSTEFDLIYVPEATELFEADWDALSSRLRNGRLSYQQLLADCNPDAPTHWLKRRCDSGRCLLLESRHEDNPRWHDGQNWTPAGKTYLSRLDRLTGPRYLRLRRGLWVQAEGVIYDGFDSAVHLLERTRKPFSGVGLPPWDWPRYLAIDFGFVEPFACLWFAVGPDGELYLYREILHTRRLVEEHAQQILDLHGQEVRKQKFWAVKRFLASGEAPPEGVAREQAIARLEAEVSKSLRPRAVICDHDAEGRATLEKHLEMSTTPARKAIREGIDSVASRLKVGENRKPRLYFLRDSLVERDPGLKEAGKPCCLEEEITSWVWDLGNGRKRGDTPVDRDNHSLDALRYMVQHLDYNTLPAGSWGVVEI